MKLIVPLKLLAAAPVVNNSAGKLDSAVEFDKIGSMVAGSVVDNNYSWNTYVRSPSIQEICYPFPLTVYEN
jgi:hypothetical protein